MLLVLRRLFGTRAMAERSDIDEIKYGNNIRNTFNKNVYSLDRCTRILVY